MWSVGLPKTAGKYSLATPTKIKGIKARPFGSLSFPSPRLRADSICGILGDMLHWEEGVFEAYNQFHRHCCHQSTEQDDPYGLDPLSALRAR
jgi:hypothetical protein